MLDNAATREIHPVSDRRLSSPATCSTVYTPRMTQGLRTVDSIRSRAISRGVGHWEQHPQRIAGPS